MTPLDRLIQRIRIRKALPHIPRGGRLLDVGCADGSLIRAAAGRVRDAVGIDPDAPAGPGLVLGSLIGAISVHLGNVKLGIGSASGLLIVAIAMSWIRTRSPIWAVCILKSP